MNTEYLIQLGQIFSRHYGLALSTISTYAFNDGKVLARLCDGAGITVRRAGNALQWFSDHWPTDLPWPTPPASPTQPTPHRNDSRNGAAKPSTDPTPSDVLAAVRAARERMHQAMQNGDSAARIEAKQAALVAGSTLGPDDTLVSPNALCLAMGIPRSTYDKVIEKYADGKPGERKRPRALRPDEEGKERKSDTQRVLEGLVASGDTRFTRRRARKAAGAVLIARALTGAG